MSAFKAGVKQIEATCRTISEAMLLNVERKRLYGNAEFTDEQSQHRALVRMRCSITARQPLPSKVVGVLTRLRLPRRRCEFAWSAHTAASWRYLAVCTPTSLLIQTRSSASGHGSS